MIDLTDLMTPRARQRVLDEGVARFSAMAVGFLRGRFGTLLSARTDAELMDMAAAAHAEGRKHGFRSDSDMLTYLIPVTVLGLHFEHDPQYAPLLEKAGWTDKGRLVERPSLTVLLAVLDEFLDAVAPDDAHLGDRIDGFARLFQAAGRQADAETATWWLARLWPARARHIGVAAVQGAAVTHLRLLAPLRLGATDTLALSGLMFRLGARCLSDPQHGWLRRVMEDPAANDEERRHMLGRAVITEIRARQGDA